MCLKTEDIFGLCFFSLCASIYDKATFFFGLGLLTFCFFASLVPWFSCFFRFFGGSFAGPAARRAVGLFGLVWLNRNVQARMCNMESSFHM